MLTGNNICAFIKKFEFLKSWICYDVSQNAKYFETFYCEVEGYSNESNFMILCNEIEESA